MSEFHATLTLYTAALQYLTCGYNLIPLHTSGSRAKLPALPWGVFQTHQAASAQVQRWFVEQHHSGLGIVTGTISQLAVLDFDDEQRLHQFLQQHPDLAQTRIVTSAVRGLPHFYYRLPKGVHVPSQRGQGVDWLAEGRYVVAPPTIIEGRAYTVAQDIEPLTLTSEQIARIAAFVRDTELETVASTPQPAGDGAGQVNVALVQQRYQQQVVAGRNNALFATACFARDHGWSQAAVETALLDLHIQQPPVNDHPPETPAQRLREAAATIASAFTRPARRREVCNAYNPVSRYPNSAREALLQRPDGAAVLRVLEGALLYGCSTNTPVTEPELVKRLRHVTCRDTIRKALTATYNGKRLFAVADPDGSKETDKKLHLSPGKNQTYSKSGPKARRYNLPTPQQLCDLLGVPLTSGDPITRDEVRSSKTYRQALHRELIKRRPQPYFQIVLGDRLGVCTRTIRYYNRQIPIHSTPTWHETPLFWFNLDLIPTESDIERYGIDTGGMCLRDNTGQRWPLKREIAAHLLRQGKRVSRLQRGPNFYWYGDQPPPTLPIAPIPTTAGQGRGAQAQDTPVFTSEGVSTAFYGAAGMNTPTYSETPRKSPEIGLPSPDDLSAGQGRVQRQEVGQPPSPQPQDAPVFTSEGLSTAFYGAAGMNTPIAPEMPRKSPETAAGVFDPNDVPSYAETGLAPSRITPPDERLAQRLHQAAPTLSLDNAQRLVACYGVEAVESAFKRMVVMQKKGRVRNPAGFIIIAARAEWRSRRPLGTPAPRFTMRKSP